ncbi:DUF5011 domain-containing protein, partial [Listeria grandensis]|uniref:LPXTG cell wall anchor domain-containing protein n=1 Tax=Listeria grandensis TaxID=1494963 RepID=UPI0016266E11
ISWFTDVTAEDKVDGDISPDVSVDYSGVDFQKEGSYPVVYSVTNSNGKTTNATVNMQITAEAPVIQANDLSAIAGTKPTDISWFTGVTAEDKVDGDISSDVSVDYSGVDFQKEGNYPVTYSVTNSNGKSASTTVNMQITAEAPVIHAKDMAAIAGTKAIDISWFTNVTAQDKVDGDISSDVSVDYSGVDFQKEGNYPVVYSVTNSNGKSASTTVNMQITAEAPVIHAKDMATIAGTKATDISWFTDVTAEDKVDGDISPDVSVDYNGVDFQKEGNYPVVYSVTNSNGKSASTTVNMQITAEAPVIHAKDMAAIAGTKATDISWFTDVTAEDKVDGDISPDVSVDYSSVNFQKEGNYPVVYSVTNSNGKSASTTVNMQITAEAPVIHAKDMATIAGTKATDISWFTDVTAEDKVDGDISPDVSVDYSGVDFQKEGNYPVTYSVTNSNGKSASTTVNMQITAEAPIIQAKDMSALVGTKATEISWFADVTAQDKTDGDISSDATVDYSSVNFQKEGNYPVVYSVTNSNGKSASTTVNMQIIADAPVISDMKEPKLLPKTGDQSHMWTVILGSMLILFSYFIIRRKKKSRTNM